ncbi:glycerol kinase GlpK [Velocimicrobium porci]|uniref:ATP:glycerol 3-phosphotransferase n=1 Tax=Velocimicrobium porci TaxID=2606634 RepID=A0A6L5XU34_9FIRM|nr:glycerol kinase GlpK [Velocimicrobium porci]MSS62310.1 glycerol kinase GlpK [Velocimicrobium porci]
MADYVLGIDQSTQGTKALLFDQIGNLICRTDLPHRQIINEKGFVEHNPIEIYQNTIQVVKNLIEKANIDKDDVKVLGISNQRETALCWDRKTGEPVYNAIVWQCARGAKICETLEQDGYAKMIRSHTGLQLSPYFSAAKLAWVLKEVPGAKEKAEKGELCCGTIDSWLVYQLTGGKEFRTDYSNASRTQLFNISTLSWDKEVCDAFGILPECLPKVTDSDGEFGFTDFDGYFNQKIPIHGVLGDSHGALFGQGCLNKGMIKTTYGTGSSIMMNIGETPVLSESVVTSLAWKMNGKVSYVLEGNINYTGAVITWLKDDLKLIESPGETEKLAKRANPKDTSYLVPAFSGLGAPYWDSEAKATIWGMSRTTKREEIVKAALESIAYQITDVIEAMSRESGITIEELRVDGGPTKNTYLMQFQSDMAQIPVKVPSAEELSGIGAAYTAGLAVGIYRKETIFSQINRKQFVPVMEDEVRKLKYQGWKEAVKKVLSK